MPVWSTRPDESRALDVLTREFLIESQEGLDRMERCLTDLEAQPQDNALLAEIFRSVHTIKGTAGFLGFKWLERLAHAGENLLDELRSVLKIVGAVEAENGEGESEDDAVMAQLEELQGPRDQGTEGTEGFGLEDANSKFQTIP